MAPIAAAASGGAQALSGPDVRDPSTAPDDCDDSSDHRAWLLSTDPMLIDDPMEPQEANEPMDPIDANEPTLRIDSADPDDPIERTEFVDHSDQRELSPMLRMLGGVLGRYRARVTGTQITRLPELASTDRGELDRLLDDTRVGHFGFVLDGAPVVIPTAIARDGDTVLAHGSTGSKWMRRLSAGLPVCLAVTALEGLVVARSAFESSMLYRSAVIFGECTPVAPERMRAALDLLTETFLPGRVAEVREPTKKELAATTVLRLPIEQWSLKLSTGWPEDPSDDVVGAAWAGVVPLQASYGEPTAAPDLRAGIAVPASVRSLVGG
jgi:nitroimidazol reductase NimA-like FMN-containing flavoprotein (pyridoxamine 5'-phosphate oxidase superfamily)